MPTGGGKFVFSIASTVKAWINLSSIATDSFNARSGRSAADNGIGRHFNSLNSYQVRSREEAILKGKVKLLYVALNAY